MTWKKICKALASCCSSQSEAPTRASVYNTVPVQPQATAAQAPSTQAPAAQEPRPETPGQAETFDGGTVTAIRAVLRMEPVFDEDNGLSSPRGR